MTDTNYRLGIDLGGTKTEMVLLDSTDNLLLLGKTRHNF